MRLGNRAIGLGFPTPRSYARALRSDMVSAPLRQKCCTPTHFPILNQTDSLFSLSLEGLSHSTQTTYK